MKQLGSSIAALVVLCGFASGNVRASGILYFNVDSNPNLYTLNTSTGAATLLGPSGTTSQNVGLTESGTSGLLYGTTWTQLSHINANGSGFVTVGAIGQEGLAFDPATGTLYGAINGSFGKFNPNTGASLGALPGPGADVEGLALGNGGVYGLADGGLLRFFNPNTNSWSTIGNTGVNFDQVGLAFDPTANILYAKGNQDSFLYAINPINANASIIGNTGIAAGGGLAFVPAAIPEPTSLALFGLATVGAACAGWRRRRVAAG